MNEQHEAFADQEKTSISRYGFILSNIHNRLVIEGYFLKGGKMWNIFKVSTPLCEIISED